MKNTAFAIALAFASGSFVLAIEPVAPDEISITTTPPGATVEWNRKVIGTTPMTYKVGEYAFNARKMTLFSKRLSQPVTLRVSLDNFIAREVVITQPMFWRSLNGRNAFTFFILPTQHFDFNLDKESSHPKTMTNDDVVQLFQAGLGDDVIIEKINGTATEFSLETADLVRLRSLNISDVVIQTMIHKSTAAH